MTYSLDEVTKATLEYFNNDELATHVFIEKYILRDNAGNYLEKSPVDMFDRLASEFARIEKNKFKNPLTKEKILEYISNFKYIVLAGSPMYGIGNDQQYVSLSNCFLAEPPEDSYSSILKTDAQLVNISKRRGGVGIDVSKLRPIGTKVHNAARTTTGIIPFIERFSNSIREVGQNGRRGALIVTLSVHHPEIENFINCKTDKSKITGANISVKLTNEFLNAVENDSEYELRWPVDSKNPKITKMIKARDIWNKIIKNAWQDGEPGILFWDNITEETPTDCYEEYKSVSCNPSLRKGTLILTKEGPKEIQNLENREFEVYNLNGSYSKAKCRLSGKNKQLYKVKLDTGMIYFCTKEHRWATERGELTTIELIRGDKLPILRKKNIFNGNLGDYDDGFLIGWFLGDGWKTLRTDNNRNQYGLICSEKDYNNGIAQKLVDILNKKINYKGNFYKREKNNSVWYELNITNALLDNYMMKFYNPDKINGISKQLICEASENFIKGLINGYFSSDGSVYKTKSITFSASGKTNKLLMDISEILGFFGIKTTLKYIKPRNITFPNGKNYNKKYDRYDLVINDITSKQHFANLFESYVDYKNNKLIEIKNMKLKQRYKPVNFVKVVSVKKTSLYEDVWDIEVFDKNNCFSLSHCITHNCSELNLSVLDSCRLMSMNLYSFVKNPFTSKAYFDYDMFKDYVMVAQRLMDDLVDLESEKIQKIIEKIESDPENSEIKRDEIEMWKKIKKHNDEGRRTGLGFLALADVFAAKNLKYGSDESIIVAGKISKTLKLAAYRSSVEMAKELGSFKEYDANLEKDHPFIVRIKKEDEELYNDMKKYGRRNISLTTIPPTGSISLLTRTSSGIEPLFQMSYTRRRKINPDDKNTKVDFIDQSGDKWQEYEVFHERILDWMKVTGENDIKKSPWNNSCANNIDWINRVKIQGKIQKNICHSISSTINLPKNVSVDTVREIYENAWKNGLKGITVYREGSRSGVLISNEGKADCANVNADKRPKELNCEIYHTKITKKLDKIRHFEYMVLIGILDGKPYELFCYENGKYDKKHEKGKIVKHSHGNYELFFEDGTSIKNITKDTTDSEDSLTRMVSLSLRHGVPVHFIVEQLNKVEGEMFCFAKSISRALKKFIKDGTISTENCEKCGNKLIFENGCYICKNCGYSKCA